MFVQKINISPIDIKAKKMTGIVTIMAGHIDFRKSCDTINIEANTPKAHRERSCL
jgi:hypothetical protein